MYLYQRYLRSGIKSRFPHSFLTDAIIELKDWYSIKLIDNEHQFDLNSLWILIYQTRGRRVDLPLPFLIERDHQATCIKSSPSLPPIQRKNPTRPHPERPDPFPARSIPRQHHSQSVTGNKSTDSPYLRTLGRLCYSKAAWSPYSAKLSLESANVPTHLLSRRVCIVQIKQDEDIDMTYVDYALEM